MAFDRSTSFGNPKTQFGYVESMFMCFMHAQFFVCASTHEMMREFHEILYLIAT